MAQNTVKAVVSHNQTIGDKKYEAGATVTLDAQLARVLQSRGAIQIRRQDDAAKVKSAPAGKEVSK